jgi:outer membrane lipoprotein SlyB
MAQVLNALNMASSPNYNIDQILQATKPPSQPSGFRRVLGGIVGGVGNIFAPGIGGLIGNAIAGNAGLNVGGLAGETMQYLQLQRQMAAETEAFETASSVIKARHDASMAAIRNIN